MTGRARHVKSHAYDDRPSDLAKLPPAEQHRFRGNMMIDMEADKAADLWHEPLIKDILAIDHMAFNAAKAVCRLAAAVLPNFPLLKHQGLYRRRPTAAPAAPPGSLASCVVDETFQAKLRGLDQLAFEGSPPTPIPDDKANDLLPSGETKLVTCCVDVDHLPAEMEKQTSQ